MKDAPVQNSMVFTDTKLIIANQKIDHITSSVILYSRIRQNIGV